MLFKAILHHQMECSAPQQNTHFYTGQTQTPHQITHLLKLMNEHCECLLYASHHWGQGSKQVILIRELSF